MDCEQARELIDLRVHELALDARERHGKKPTREARGRRGENLSEEHDSDWSALEAHLEACPLCLREFEELRRVRQLLGEAGGERPDDAEVERMWAAIQTGGIGSGTTSRGAASKAAGGAGAGWWVRNRAAVVSMFGAAAVLVVAFGLGQMRYGKGWFTLGGRSGMFSNVDSSLPTASAAGADDPNGWGIPVHPRALDDVSRFMSPSMSAEKKSAQTGAYADTEDAATSATSPRRRASIAAQQQRADLLPGPAPGVAQGGGPPSSPPELPIESNKLTFFQGGAAVAKGPPERVPPYLMRVPAELMDEVRGYGATRESDVVVNQAAKQTSNVPENLKLIKTGEVTIEVSDNTKAVEQVERIANDAGGFVADTVTVETAGGSLTTRITIRIPPERFEETFAALKAIGRVASENVKVADVTAEYVDLEARIHSLKITEERLRELIANKSFVDKMSALLEVERELNRVRTQIEQYQGQLRVMADRVALSTIVVTLREPARTVPSASLSVEVSVLTEAADAIGKLLAEYGGRMLSGRTSKRGDGTLMGEYQLETTLAKFAELTAAIEALGRVEQRQVSDLQFGSMGEAWADRVDCTIALVLFERSRQMPSGNLHVEVNTLDEAMPGLAKLLTGFDATMVSNQATRNQTGANSANIQIRVPAGKFAALLTAIDPLGRVLAKSVSGETENIEGGAAVVPCNLSLTLAERTREVPRGSLAIEVATFDPAREALSKAIAERKVQVLNSASNQRNDGTWVGSFRLGVPAKELETFVSAVGGLGRVVNRQISGIGLGDLSSVDPESIGVIDLTLGEKSALSPAPDQSTASIRARVRDGLAGFYTSIGMIAYGLVVLAPWLVLAAVLWFVVSRVRGMINKHRGVGVQGG